MIDHARNRKKVTAAVAAVLLLLVGLFTILFNHGGGSSVAHAMTSTAACDGSTDDTATINANLTTMGNQGGGEVVLPATGHNCKITGTVNVPAGVILKAQSPMVSGKESLWFASTSNGPAVQLGTGAGTTPIDYHGGGLQNIGIVGNSSSGGYPNQIGVKVISTVNAFLSNVYVNDMGIGYDIDGGPTSNWDGETNIVNPMASNVVTGIEYTNSGGTETDQHITGGYENGVSTSSGYGFYANGLHSSVMTGLSEEHFGHGFYLTTGTQSNEFFGGRAEQSGPKDGSVAYVCDGSGVNSNFWGEHDSDVVTTTLHNNNSATCVQK